MSLRERRIQYYAKEAYKLWNKASQFTTEKARTAFMLRYFPYNMIIQQQPIKAIFRDEIERAMYDVLEIGNWVGLRTCYDISRLGGAPWKMGVKTKEDVQRFFGVEYDDWLNESGWAPHLREIIVLSNPPHLGGTEHDNQHFVFRISPRYDQITVEMRPETSQLRDLEETKISRRDERFSEHLIHIMMPVNGDSSLLGREEPLRYVFGKSYISQIDEHDYRNIRKAMLNGELDEHAYKNLIDHGIWNLIQNIASTAFDRWLSYPYSIWYRLTALRRVCGFDVGEFQGSYNPDSGEINYTLMYEMRGREEKMIANSLSKNNRFY